MRREATVTEPDLTVVLGTRPEIVKTAPVVAAARDRGLATRVVHTGQHYSESMTDVFFRSLELDPPAVNLEVGSGSHGEQTGAMLADVARDLRVNEPTAVVVQGDTNSTLAGALAGAKLDTTVAHVEAGLRSGNRAMPEELNRIVVDHLADALFPPTDESEANLRREGIDPDRITVTGNTVVDAVHAYGAVADRGVLDRVGVGSGEYLLATAHRAETVDEPDRFHRVLRGMASAGDRLDLPVVYPIHPRARGRLDEFDLAVPDRIRLVEPVDFLAFLALERHARVALTDSGGVQEECCILGTPCVTLRYDTERPETVHVGANCLAGREPADVRDAAVRMAATDGDWPVPLGDGDAAARIVDTLFPTTAPDE